MTSTDPQHTRTTDPDPPVAVAPEPARAALQRTAQRWGDAMVGAAAATGDLTTDLVGGLRRRATGQGRRAARLADRGAAERARWRTQADRTAQAVLTALATSPVIDRVVDHQLQRVLRPVVLAVLDDVLLLLEKEPDRIQALVRGQRETMVDELVGRLRAGAEAGDTAVDRLTYRVFHRAPRSGPAAPPGP